MSGYDRGFRTVCVPWQNKNRAKGIHSEARYFIPLNRSYEVWSL